MRRRLVSALLAAGLLTSFLGAGVASAHTEFRPQTFACEQAATYVSFYGSDWYDHQTNYFRLCPGQSFTNLKNMIDNPHHGGNCAGALGIDNGHWNNCISSLFVTFSGSGYNYHLCIYRDANFSLGGNGLDVQGNWSVADLNGIVVGGQHFDDSITSVRWIPDQNSC